MCLLYKEPIYGSCCVIIIPKFQPKSFKKITACFIDTHLLKYAFSSRIKKDIFFFGSRESNLLRK